MRQSRGRTGRKKTVYYGGFTAAACLVASATHSRKYEWPPFVVETSFTTTGSGAVTLETFKQTKVMCAGEMGGDSITGAKTLGSFVVKFTGCESGGHECATAGLGEGEIESARLEASEADMLMSSLDGAAPEQGGLALIAMQTYGEVLEVSAVL